MTAVTAARPATPVRQVVSQLALAEARRLLRHPVVLAGLLLSLIASVAATADPDARAGGLPFLFLSGAAVWPLAVGGFLAANLAAVRTRRHGTVELEDTTVTGPADRTLGVLAAMAALTTLGLLLVLVDTILFGAWDGLPVRLFEGYVDRAMHPAELAQGPLVVTFMAALGVAVGRWVPSRLLGPLMLVPAVVGFFQVTWRFDGIAWRFAPVMVHEEQIAWVQVTPGSGYSILGGFATTDLTWHLVYLVGLTVVCAAVAVARFERSRRVASAAGVGVLLAALGGLLQLP